jgi:mannose-6-phosphate isomerase
MEQSVSNRSTFVPPRCSSLQISDPFKSVTKPSPSPPAELASIAERTRGWLLEACFPFWVERARHPAGGFRERLALDGTPLDDAVSRVRVQARQTYFFARAKLLGWEPARADALIDHGLEALLGPCRRDDGLVGRMVTLGRGLDDPQPELYDNAFAVLALAWASRALARPDLANEAAEMLATLDQSHAHPAGGYAESQPPRLPRRQNPHMHVYEACLATAAAGERAAVARADTIERLLETRFWDRRTGHLREYFDDALSPLPGETGDVVEPGHEFEWVALLAQRAALDDRSLSPLAAELYAAGLKGLDAAGFAPLSTRLDSTPRDAGRRTWSQSEALRAHLAMMRHGDAEAGRRAVDLAEAIFAAHLDPAPLGGWIDHYDAEGRPGVDSITAATGYHLATAFIELMEAAASQTA